MAAPPSKRSFKTFIVLALTLILAWITATATPLPVSDPLLFSSSHQYLPLIQNPFIPPVLDHLLITELMADPLAGQVEWVEVYNPTAATVDLSGCKIGDEETIGGPEAMRQFPLGATIQPGQVLVLALEANAFQAVYGFLPDYEIVNTGSPVPDLFDYVPWANGAFSLANAGDELLLLDFFDNLVDSVAWGDSTWSEFYPPAANPDQGSTLERFPAYLDTGAASDWREQTQPQPGEVNLSPPPPTPTMTPTPGPTPTPFGGGLLISEVVYDPAGTEPNAEWIEIYNTTGQTLTLANFKIGDEEMPGESEGMYQFPSGNITPGEAIVIANRASDFQIAHGFSPDFELTDTNPDVPDMVKYTAWSGGSVSLTNAGDQLLLLDYYNTLVDSLSWGNSTWELDPFETPAPLVPEGHSLERRPPYQDTDSAADWQDQPLPTPGMVDLSTPTPSPTPTLTPTPFSSGLYISEVLYDPTGTEPNAEWIEIYNATETTLSLTGFKIGDEEMQGGGEGMYQFPAGAIASPGAVIVIANRASDFSPGTPDYELTDTDPTVPDMVKYTAWASGSVNLANAGDEVLLLDPGDNLLDGVAWGNSTWPVFNPPVPGVPAGHSIERLPADQDTDAAADWQDQPNPDPGAVNLTPPTPTNTPTPTTTPIPFSGALLITEVLYDHATEPAGEWMEIYNFSGQTIDLSTFKIGDEETQGVNEGMFQFPPGSTMTDGEVVIIANQASVFTATYGFHPDYELVDTDPTVPDMIEYAAWASGNISLSNTGDEVLLLDGGDNLIDAVSWGSSNWAFDPPIPGIAEGHSIERVPADQDNDDNTDWQDQPDPHPGIVTTSL